MKNKVLREVILKKKIEIFKEQWIFKIKRKWDLQGKIGGVRLQSSARHRLH
jgi:hypothetical protein